MATRIKEFHFTTTTEGWTATPGDATIEMAWFDQHRPRGNLRAIRRKDALAPLAIMGGCLRTTVKANSPGGINNYWEWTGTWQDLGVPAGSIVTNCQGDYIWRVSLQHHRKSHNSDATWNTGKGGNPLWGGPFDLYDSAGTSLLGNFSGADTPPNRASGGALAWPAGGADDAVSFTPVSWQHLVGSNLSIAAPQQPSNSTIRLRLASHTPSTANAAASWIRVKQDYVKLTITYTPPAAGNFFSFTA